MTSARVVARAPGGEVTLFAGAAHSYARPI